MPFYEYRCPAGHVTTIRRHYDEMDAAANCDQCGTAATRQFSPTSNLHIPLHMQANHGAGLSWSDFHEETERELAHNDHISPANRARSAPGKRTT